MKFEVQSDQGSIECVKTYLKINSCIAKKIKHFDQLRQRSTELMKAIKGRFEIEWGGIGKSAEACNSNNECFAYPVTIHWRVGEEGGH